MKTANVNQVAAFGKLVGICNDLGATYNPSKVAITTTALTTLLEQARLSVEAVDMTGTAYALAINARKERFDEILPLASRIVRAVSAFESSRENIREAKLIKRKLTPQRKVKDGESGKFTYTTSHLDFVGMVSTFESLVRLVEAMPAYQPNEIALQVETLKAMIPDFFAKSEAVSNAGNALANARIHRNKVLYGPNGMFETATAVKEYIRSVFGVRSEPAREVGKLKLVA